VEHEYRHRFGVDLQGALRARLSDRPEHLLRGQEAFALAPLGP
jgi:hypothetical protein